MNAATRVILPDLHPYPPGFQPEEAIVLLNGSQELRRLYREELFYRVFEITQENAVGLTLDLLLLSPKFDSVIVNCPDEVMASVAAKVIAALKDIKPEVRVLVEGRAYGGKPNLNNESPKHPESDSNRAEMLEHELVGGASTGSAHLERFAFWPDKHISEVVDEPESWDNPSKRKAQWKGERNDSLGRFGKPGPAFQKKSKRR